MLEASWWRKPDFPQKTLSECLGILQNGAKATAREVATQIATSSHRGFLGGEFAAISWSLMGIWRQIYYLRRLEEGHYDEFPDFAGLEGQAPSFLNSSEWGTSEESTVGYGKGHQKGLGGVALRKGEGESLD